MRGVQQSHSGSTALSISRDIAKQKQCNLGKTLFTDMHGKYKYIAHEISETSRNTIFSENGIHRLATITGALDIYFGCSTLRSSRDIS
ncbi:hypothetical protein T01_4282 [Trichinella spiralis]|uniref:Uncharacterized protein n=1 Tax=Trichinella spiralis TaxID=6334 RepID=A0A0V1B481_TRISP|nr:hypothetical protein T01_4282 [Trichinella spiralis]